MATQHIDFTKPIALKKAVQQRPDAGTNWFKHNGDRFPGLLLGVGKTKATWYLKKRINGTTKSIRVGAFEDMTATQAMDHAEIKNDATTKNAKIATVLDGWEFHCNTSQAAGSMSDGDRARRTGMLKRHAANLLKLHPADVTSAMVQECINALVRDGKRATARQVRASLRSAFNFAGVENPVANKGVRAPKSNERESKLAVAAASQGFDADDWSVFWKVITDIRNPTRRNAWIVMLFTGIRSENVRSLTWDQIDFEARTIHLDKMKNGLSRTMPVCDTVMRVLAAQRSNHSHVFPADSRTGHIDHLDALRIGKVKVLVQHDTRRHFMQAAAESFLPEYVAKWLRGDKQGGAGNDMLMRYLKRMGNHEAPNKIEAAIIERIGPSFDLDRLIKVDI